VSNDEIKRNIERLSKNCCSSSAKFWS